MNLARNFRRRTKIVATIGPATASAHAVERLVRAGMNVARLNLSHGRHEEHRRYLRNVRSVSRRLGQDVAILMDLPGPKYRTGAIPGGETYLKKGATIRLVGQGATQAGDVPVTPPGLPRQVRLGDTVLVNDGAMKLKVTAVTEEAAVCRVVVGGLLTGGRGLVVPGMAAEGPFVTEALSEKLMFALGEGPDFLAVSFVSSGADVRAVREAIGAAGADVPVIAKIEKGEAVRDFRKILAESDGIMVARGDLGVDIPLEKVPGVQKDIILACNRAGKPVITATQMLESMIHAPRPTRAEVADVANAIFDGTDATMLSGETSVGEYPVQAVRIMARVAEAAERRIDYGRGLAESSQWLELQTDELICYNAAHTAYALGAAAIVALTTSGSTAQRVAKYRPQMPVLALTPRQDVCRRLLLSWGVHPFPVDGVTSVEELFTTGARLAHKLGVARPGDIVVITGGIPLGVAGGTNILKVEEIT